MKNRTGELRLEFVKMFCQHCKALQKVMGWKGKPCWLLQYNEPEAICASAHDAGNYFLKACKDKGLRFVSGEFDIIEAVNHYRDASFQLAVVYDEGKFASRDAIKLQIEEIEIED